MTLTALPIFVKLAGRPVILIGSGEAAEAKRRLLERAGAEIVGEEAQASLAIVAADEPEPIVARLRSRGVLVNTVDRPDLCDFTLPAIVERDPVLVAIGTGGVSAGLAAALRQRLETELPADLGETAKALHAARTELRARFPDIADRRRAIGAALAEGLGSDVVARMRAPEDARLVRITLASDDPDDLTLRQARALAQAERVYHFPGVPTAILNRARADAPRIACSAPPEAPGPGLSIWLEPGA
ncbi:uroporphyrin-III C-methyltransferase/precorrin-2 dehydrogenase/sirohydrochlorin ferrochelatase [Sphingomonas kyeonggiensis]|uniref:precorrin-2 dehydrogenase n=1 Tax=Sphingomonas kyeonggiensis TaxID=1268553 RepID=A0A7W7JZ96_9SPHN|nr:bifunctional precorrin-2 dehydrogenase/sirohydrochlorin ferrochelatase [Sphingomonas kyeonggiensis]MBB4837831.1 uroporphyrin-III C-methyltransferase/precorrin-2 dehydrogenase/sirohydrochlorin ferrochelatase [Sphingomonas kyeonggiensis]